MSRAGCLPENRFSVPYLGRTFRFCRRSAWQELQFSGAAERLLEHLPGADLPGRQKQAVAGNAVLLWQALDGPDAAGSPKRSCAGSVPARSLTSSGSILSRTAAGKSGMMSAA